MRCILRGVEEGGLFLSTVQAVQVVKVAHDLGYLGTIARHSDAEWQGILVPGRTVML